MKNKQTLIFVYNADADIFSQVTDYAHKIFKPETYSCNLCSLTYGALTMKQAWKIFLEALPYEKVFLHKDEWEKSEKTIKGPLPAIFLVTSEGVKEILSSADINQAQSLVDLQKALEDKLSKI